MTDVKKLSDDEIIKKIQDLRKKLNFHHTNQEVINSLYWHLDSLEEEQRERYILKSQEETNSLSLTDDELSKSEKPDEKPNKKSYFK